MSAIWLGARLAVGLVIACCLGVFALAAAYEVSDRNARRRAHAEARQNRIWDAICRRIRAEQKALDAIGTYRPESGQSFTSFVYDGPIERWTSVEAVAGIRVGARDGET